MKNTIYIIFFFMIILLAACKKTTPPTPSDITTIDTETTAYEPSVRKPLVYEIEGDMTVLREYCPLMPVEPSVGIDWNSNMQEITTYVYYEV